MWDVYTSDPLPEESECIYVTDPYVTGNSIRLRPNHKHIKLLKDHKARGYGVIVWSAGGSAWARAAVEALELESYVDVILAKPAKFVDDLQATEILGTRIYLNEHSKENKIDGED